MRIIIDTAADPTVHLVIAVAAAAFRILAAAEPDTVATSPKSNSLQDLERHFDAADTAQGPNSSFGPFPCFLLIHYVPSHHPPISSLPAGQTRTVAVIVHPSH